VFKKTACLLAATSLPKINATTPNISFAGQINIFRLCTNIIQPENAKLNEMIVTIRKNINSI
jgi:hypothetical protein